MFQQFLIILLLAVTTTCIHSDHGQTILTQSDVEKFGPSHGGVYQPYQASGKNTTITFDDIHFPESIGNISHYGNFTITDFQIFDPERASKEGLFPTQDINCATPCPNALLGRRTTLPWPRIVLNPSPDGKDRYFRMKSLSLKAIGYVPAWLMVVMNGFEVTDARLVVSYESAVLYDREGYRESYLFLFTPERGWPGKINVLEIWVQHNDGNTDWPFCIDDLNVEFEES